MFSGLSAFPLTPFAAGKPDEAAFLRLLRRLTDAKVDSLGVLGATGSYAYLTRAQRRRISEPAGGPAEFVSGAMTVAQSPLTGLRQRLRATRLMPC